MSDSKQDIMSLAAQLGKYEGIQSKLPPVADWDPELSGDMDMIIRADGSWIHEGDIIQRDALVRIFSTILKKEGDDYFLVTPVEKWRIQVEEEPFNVVLIHVKGEGESLEIKCITNVGDEFSLGSEHRLMLNESGMPYVEVRSGLVARLNRNVYYELAELAELADEVDGGFYVWSGGLRQQIG